MVGETYLEKKEKTLTSADSVKTGTATIRGVSVDVYNKVNATYFNNREEIPPSPQNLFIEFSKPIYDQFTRSIKRFYDDY